MSVLLDLWRNGTVDHDLSEFVPLRSDVVHQHLVGGQGVFDGGLGGRVQGQLTNAITFSSLFIQSVLLTQAKRRN